MYCIVKWKVELRIGKAPSIVYSLESEDSETHVSSVNTGEREKQITWLQTPGSSSVWRGGTMVTK